MSQQTLALITQLVATWNSHDPELVAQGYSEDCHILDVAIAQPLSGRLGVQGMFAAYYRAFPDLEITPDDVIVTGARVALFWTARGTHQGPILNIPASGRRVETRGVNRLVLRDGQVVATLTIWDVAGMLRGLGLLPDL
ncbi:MAG: ester cyclase [Anaerolinea sp.]|nr:ester cyclase [Anaerolinea sp.]